MTFSKTILLLLGTAATAANASNSLAGFPVEALAPEHASPTACAAHSLPNLNQYVEFDHTCRQGGDFPDLGCVAVTPPDVTPAIHNGCKWCGFEPYLACKSAPSAYPEGTPTYSTETVTSWNTPSTWTTSDYNNPLISEPSSLQHASRFPSNMPILSSYERAPAMDGPEQLARHEANHETCASFSKPTFSTHVTYDENCLKPNLLHTHLGCVQTTSPLGTPAMRNGCRWCGTPPFAPCSDIVEPYRPALTTQVPTSKNLNPVQKQIVQDQEGVQMQHIKSFVKDIQRTKNVLLTKTPLTAKLQVEQAPKRKLRALPAQLTVESANTLSCKQTYQNAANNVWAMHDNTCLASGGEGCISTSHGDLPPAFNGCRYCGFASFPACSSGSGSSMLVGASIRNRIAALAGGSRSSSSGSVGALSGVENVLNAWSGVSRQQATEETCKQRYSNADNNIFVMHDNTCVINGGEGCISFSPPEASPHFNGCRYCGFSSFIPCKVSPRHDQITVRGVMSQEANELTCKARYQNVENNIHVEHDPSCVVMGGEGCISITTGEQAPVFNGCRYCGFEAFPSCSRTSSTALAASGLSRQDVVDKLVAVALREDRYSTRSALRNALEDKIANALVGESINRPALRSLVEEKIANALTSDHAFNRNALRNVIEDKLRANALATTEDELNRNALRAAIRTRLQDKLVANALTSSWNTPSNTNALRSSAARLVGDLWEGKDQVRAFLNEALAVVNERMEKVSQEKEVIYALAENLQNMRERFEVSEENWDTVRQQIATLQASFPNAPLHSVLAVIRRVRQRQGVEIVGVRTLIAKLETLKILEEAHHTKQLNIKNAIVDVLSMEYSVSNLNRVTSMLSNVHAKIGANRQEIAQLAREVKPLLQKLYSEISQDVPLLEEALRVSKVTESQGCTDCVGVSRNLDILLSEERKEADFLKEFFKKVTTHAVVEDVINYEGTVLANLIAKAHNKFTATHSEL